MNRTSDRPPLHLPRRRPRHLLARAVRRLRGIALRIAGGVVTIDGIRLRLDRRISTGMIGRILTGLHTADERAVVLPELRPTDVVMELGGGIGMLAVACAKAVGEGRVHSYEPNPDLSDLARANYRLNRVEVELHTVVLGDGDGERTFHVAEHFGRSSLFEERFRKRSVTVRQRDLNLEIASVRPTVLILDVQGQEEELLGILEPATLETVMVELHPDLLGADLGDRVRRRMATLGFELARIWREDYHLYRRTVRAGGPDHNG